ncbi:PspA/IM30 family protein [Paenibacillus ginsengihumi]|uniref:PspA/IM30 family protein n=1 Tax=Paenibacillus ginsengihumi TaxID=431596 RepID=UPI00037D5D15|nr:PspA/IM30 family protein [Paenibacillus ginsengihumi]
MGILSRFKEIMASNIHALLDKSENPETTIREYMRMLSADLGKVKAEMASVLADERRAKRAWDECRSEIDKLQRYAEKAVEAGDDQRAIKFLERKAALNEKLSRLQAALDVAASNASNMKRMQDKLASDIGQLETRLAALQGKMAAAKAQQTLNDISSAVNGADSALAALEEKVNQAYAEAMAIAELRAEANDDLDELLAPYSQSERSPSAEEELAAIKEKLNKKK